MTYSYKNLSFRSHIHLFPLLQLSWEWEYPIYFSFFVFLFILHYIIVIHCSLIRIWNFPNTYHIPLPLEPRLNGQFIFFLHLFTVLQSCSNIFRWRIEIGYSLCLSFEPLNKVLLANSLLFFLVNIYSLCNIS